MVMRKLLVGASVAALAVYSANVLADDSPTPQPAPQATPVQQPSPTADPTQPTPTPQPVAPPVTVSRETQTTVQTTQAASPPVGSATVTSAATAPDPSTMSRESDTVTLYQKRRPNKPLLYTGGLIFAGSYGTTALVTAVNDNDRSLYIPVVGPWMHLADMPSTAGTADTILTAGSGILQGAGVLIALSSLVIPEKVASATIQAGNTKINFTPTSYGRGSAGIGAIGTF
jgi:hypothetical protein